MISVDNQDSCLDPKIYVYDDSAEIREDNSTIIDLLLINGAIEEQAPGYRMVANKLFNLCRCCEMSIMPWTGVGSTA